MIVIPLFCQQDFYLDTKEIINSVAVQLEVWPTGHSTLYPTKSYMQRGGYAARQPRRRSAAQPRRSYPLRGFSRIFGRISLHLRPFQGAGRAFWNRNPRRFIRCQKGTSYPPERTPLGIYARSSHPSCKPGPVGSDYWRCDECSGGILVVPQF